MSDRKLPMAEKLIVALDVHDARIAYSIIDRLDGIVSFYKIGPQLIYNNGLRVVDALISSGKKVFLDIKLFDTPDTVINTIKTIDNMGVQFVTVCSINLLSLRAALETRINTRIIAVRSLTTVKGSITGLVSNALSMHRAGADGIIGPSIIADPVHKYANNSSFKVITPGIRPQGVLPDNHKWVSTPAQAIKDGTDYLVIGRPITQADDPAYIVNAIIKEMEVAV